jgi:DNA processing protein
MTQSALLYQIGLTLVPGIGDVNGKKLVAYCGSPEAVFKEKKHVLMRIPGIGHAVANNLHSRTVLDRAEKEIRFMETHGVQSLFFTEAGYPARLQNCEDGPMMLYFSGHTNLNPRRTVGIVGTRRATNYGKSVCNQFIEHLLEKEVQVISGLAYGIDSCAHRKAVELGVDTIGVLGHGLDRLYPAQNRKLSERMKERGGLLTEFLSGTKPDRENFPKRNRIVAGMCDAVVVIESDRKGGAIITAELANSYNRDVFAVPGRVGDESSRGCNFLIRTNRAALAEKGEDVSYFMGWDDKPVKKKQQTSLFVELSDQEKALLEMIREKGEMPIDGLVMESGFPTSRVAAALLNLEFEGLIESLPGKIYKA